MKRTDYPDSIEWIIDNDDSFYLDGDEPVPSMTALFLADIFGVTIEKVIADLRKQHERLNK